MRQTYSTAGNVKAHIGRDSLDRLFESEKHFLPEVLDPNTSVLDIGCGPGSISQAFLEIEPTITYTGIDVDEQSIDVGKAAYPEIELIRGHFPKDLEDRTFDVVYTTASVFSFVPDWRDLLREFVKVGNKYIYLVTSLRLAGPTVVDDELSYFYYLDSGERHLFVVHNLYELMNFCCTEQIRARSIRIWGYHLTTGSTVYYPLPRTEVIKASVLIDLLPEDARVMRFGGEGSIEQTRKLLGAPNSFRTQVEVVIDDQPIDI